MYPTTVVGFGAPDGASPTIEGGGAAMDSACLGFRDTLNRETLYRCDVTRAVQVGLQFQSEYQ
jgi:hypothetical protein